MIWKGRSSSHASLFAAALPSCGKLCFSLLTFFASFLVYVMAALLRLTSYTPT